MVTSRQAASISEFTERLFYLVAEKRRHSLKQLQDTDALHAALRKILRERINSMDVKTVQDIDVALMTLGMASLPVMVAAGWTDAKKRAYVIADNKLAMNAGWDNELLALELGEIGDLGFDLDLTGFTADEIAALMPEQIEPGQTDEDAVPEVPEQPVTVLGDIWILGKHRLMCGDSTSIDAVDKLMDGQKADMVFTDPPYNIASEKPSAAGQIRNSFKRLNESEWDKDFNFLDVAGSITVYLADDASVYVCTSHHLLGQILDWMKEDFKSHGLCVWKKPNPMPSLHKRHWTWCTEFICYATKGKHTFNFPQTGHALSVWEIDKQRSNDLHPTMKPVDMLENQVKIVSDIGDLCLDLFGGSGSTLIACEKTNRINYSMELDEKYCDVIVKRWQDFTGKQATLESTGEPYGSHT
jgi:DNA modification methylase